jgi:hypothetical protein
MQLYRDACKCVEPRVRLVALALQYFTNPLAEQPQEHTGPWNRCCHRGFFDGSDFTVVDRILTPIQTSASPLGTMTLYQGTASAVPKVRRKVGL